MVGDGCYYNDCYCCCYYCCYRFQCYYDHHCYHYHCYDCYCYHTYSAHSSQFSHHPPSFFLHIPSSLLTQTISPTHILIPSYLIYHIQVLQLNEASKIIGYNKSAFYQNTLEENFWYVRTYVLTSLFYIISQNHLEALFFAQIISHHSKSFLLIAFP